MSKNGKSKHGIGIYLSVEPWLYNYLSSTLGPSPWDITTRGVAEGKVIFSNLGGKVSRFNKPVVYEPQKQQVKYTMIVPWRWYERYNRCSLSEEAMDHLISYFHDKFHREMMLWIESRIHIKNTKGEAGIYIEDAIKDFCEKHNIHEDIMPLDTIKKRYWREIKRLKSRIVCAF